MRCKTLKAFSFCHYLSKDLKQYMDILKIFITKHGNLSEISIAFNSMSDVSLSQLLNIMHTTGSQNGLIHNLEFIDFEFTKLDDFELSDSFCLVKPSEIEYQFEPNQDGPILDMDQDQMKMKRFGR